MWDEDLGRHLNFVIVREFEDEGAAGVFGVEVHAERSATDLASILFTKGEDVSESRGS